MIHCNGITRKVVLLAMIGLLAVFKMANAEQPSNLTIAPAFELIDLNGNKINLAQYQGKVVVLNFWGTFCTPCLKETPALVAIQQQFAKQGVVVIGAAMDKNNDAEVKAFAKKFFVNYSMVIASGSLLNDYAIAVAPTTLIIDKYGKIAFRHIGALTRNDLEQLIKPLL